MTLWKSASRQGAAAGWNQCLKTIGSEQLYCIVRTALTVVLYWPCLRSLERSAFVATSKTRWIKYCGATATSTNWWTWKRSSTKSDLAKDISQVWTWPVAIGTYWLTRMRHICSTSATHTGTICSRDFGAPALLTDYYFRKFYFIIIIIKPSSKNNIYKLN